MAKFPMDWHVQCHKEHRAYLAKQRNELNNMEQRVMQSEKELEFYTAQINEAAARGLKEFDAEKLLKRKGLAPRHVALAVINGG